MDAHEFFGETFDYDAIDKLGNIDKEELYDFFIITFPLLLDILDDHANEWFNERASLYWAFILKLLKDERYKELDLIGSYPEIEDFLKD